MLQHNISYGLLGCLAIALLFAAFTDIRRRQIDNWLNAGIALAAPVFWWASGLQPWPDAAIQLGLALGVFAVLSAFFALKMMGGGDVKLITALALWVPPAAFLELIMVMAIFGGMLTLVFGAWHITRRRKDRISIPYGIAIAIGALWVIGTKPIAFAGAAPMLG